MKDHEHDEIQAWLTKRASIRRRQSELCKVINLLANGGFKSFRVEKQEGKDNTWFIAAWLLDGSEELLAADIPQRIARRMAEEGSAAIATKLTSVNREMDEHEKAFPYQGKASD